MKNILTKWSLSLLTLTAVVLSLMLIQQQVWAAWEAPSVEPGDQSGVNTPLIPNDLGEVDLQTNDLINVGDLRVDTLTATTSLSVLGTFDVVSLETNSLKVPHSLGVSGLIDISALDSSIQLTAANSAASGAPTKAAYFISGSSASGGSSYGLYAATDAISGVNPNYALAGVSNNIGGTAVYGLANEGWAGYFSGPVGIAGPVSLGNNTTASGAYSLSIGANTTASGDHSLAAGDSSESSGAESVALGFASVASGGTSLAAGSEATASGFASIALGMNPTASGIQSVALGYYAQASAENAIALGPITVSGLNSLGINLDSGTPQTFSQANSMAIMGGNVGINTLTPGYKLHVIGSYYQDGMMQVKPTTALGATENIIYANLPSGSNGSANLLLLQNNGVDRFKVSSTGAGTFASSISATQGTFSNGLTVSGTTAAFNAGATVSGVLTMKSGASISFTGSKGSYFDFNDDDGTAPPSCAAGTAGTVYNFKLNNVLCYCNGTAWFSMVNGKADALCATK